MKFPKLIEKTGSCLKSLFLNGLFTALPITATIFFVHFTYNLLAHWLEPLKRIEPLFLQKIPGSEIILVTILILIFGALIKFLIVSPLIHYFERVVNKIPLVRTVYSSIKTLIDSFYGTSPIIKDKQVVLIEYPQAGSYNLAFLLGSTDNNYSKILPKSEQEKGKKFFKVFMPNSPNPTSGYFFILPEEKITPTNLTFEEAIKAAVTCGLITPESLKKL
jgi:uncharacterized membrane protein